MKELWIARDLDNSLGLTDEKPVLTMGKRTWGTSSNSWYIPLDESLFPEITFENSPRKVKIELV